MRKTQNDNRRENHRENRRSTTDNEYTGPLFVIRWKWLLGTIALMTVLVSVAVTAYYFQTRNQTEFRIQLFRKAADAGHWLEGIEQLVHYHREKPNEMVIIRELADAYDRNGVAPVHWRNAAGYYRELLGHLSSDEDRLQTLEKMLGNHRRAFNTEEMADVVRRIMEMSPENPLAWKCLVILQAQSLAAGTYRPGTGEPQSFDLLIKKAMDFNPGDVELTSAYARLLRSGSRSILGHMSQEFNNIPLETRVEEADSLMAHFAKTHADSVKAILADAGSPVTADLADAHKDSIEALLADYAYRRQFRLLDPEAETLDDALVLVHKLDPNNPALMMFTGMFYEQKALRYQFSPGTWNTEEYKTYRRDAIDQFEQMIQANPEIPDGYLQLAAIYDIDGNKDNQIAILEKGCKATNASRLELLIPLVSAYLENNDPKNADRVISLIHVWAERNRLATSKESLEAARQIAVLLSGQSRATAGHPVDAIARFRSVLEPVIPRSLDVRILYTSMMVYALALNDTLNPDSAVAIYRQILGHLSLDMYSGDPLNPSRINETYGSLIGTLSRLRRTDDLAAARNDYAAFLRNHLLQNPGNQAFRLTLVEVLLQQIMSQPAQQRNWSGLEAELDILQANKFRFRSPWQVDILQAIVTWEKLGRIKAENAEVLIPLRTAENRYNLNKDDLNKDDLNNDHLLFLVNLEEIYHLCGSPEDSERVLELIRTIPKGLPSWYLIKALRAELRGDTRETKRLMDEALTELPEDLKKQFLDLQENLERASDPNENSIVRERRNLERLRDMNAKEPTIQNLFQQGLMELDLGNTDAVAPLEIELRKLEGGDDALSLLLEGFRLVLEAADARDPKFDKARSNLQKLKRQRPDWEYTHLLAVDIAEKTGDESGAIEALVNAIRAGNRDPFRYRDLIDLYHRANQEARARTVLEQGVLLFSNFGDIPHFRFDHPYQLFYKDFIRAIRRDDADAARQIAGKWLPLAEQNDLEERQMTYAYFVVAQNYFSIERLLSESEPYFVKAAASGGIAVLPLARYYGHTGRMQEAMQLIYPEMASSQTPGVFLRPVWALMQNYGYDPAWAEPFDAFVLDFQPALTDEPGDLSSCIEYLVFRGKNDDTLPFYRRLNELFPEQTTVLNDLAYMTAFQQTDDDAEREANIQDALVLIDTAINLEKDDAHSANLIDTKGLIVLLQGHPDEAVALFEKAVELSSHLAILYRLHLAVALLRDQQNDRAEEEFTVVREMLVSNLDFLSESNRNFTRELLDAFPE